MSNKNWRMREICLYYRLVSDIELMFKVIFHKIVDPQLMPSGPMTNRLRFLLLSSV